jgi:hypothetical protein
MTERPKRAETAPTVLSLEEPLNPEHVLPPNGNQRPPQARDLDERSRRYVSSSNVSIPGADGFFTLIHDVDGPDR